MTLTEPVREKLDGAALSAHLATSVDDRPHVAPVWFTLDDEADAIWFLTGGRKLANLRENPRVALSIESADRAGTVDWQVTMLGTARVVVDDDEREAWVDRRIAETYAMHADPETDGGGGDTATDGGEAADGDGDEYEGALVRVGVASASLSEY